MEKDQTGGAQSDFCGTAIAGELYDCQGYAPATREFCSQEKKTCFADVNRLLSSQEKKLPDASSIEELCQRFGFFSKTRFLLSGRRSNTNKSRKAYSR